MQELYESKEIVTGTLKEIWDKVGGPFLATIGELGERKQIPASEVLEILAASDTLSVRRWLGDTENIRVCINEGKDEPEYTLVAVSNGKTFKEELRNSPVPDRMGRRTHLTATHYGTWDGEVMDIVALGAVNIKKQSTYLRDRIKVDYEGLSYYPYVFPLDTSADTTQIVGEQKAYVPRVFIAHDGNMNLLPEGSDIQDILDQVEVYLVENNAKCITIARIYNGSN